MTTPGLGISLPVEVTDTDYPWEVLRDDPRLRAGSLVLVDPAHPANSWDSGVPANGALVPNLAWREAKTVLGAGTQSTLSAVVEKSAAITGSLGKVERSTKGGLHVILSASTLLSAGQGVAIRLPQLVMDYMIANLNHSYFFSLWFKGTRFTSSNGAPHAFTLANATSDTTSLWFVNNSAGPGSFPTAGKLLGYRRSITDLRVSSNAGLAAPYQSPVIFNGAVSGYTGTPVLTGSAAQAKNKLFSAGNMEWFREGQTIAAASRLFWCAAVEDLTVSGVSYAEADAADLAEYTKHVLTSGGRYYGDTYTDPATIA